MVFSRRARSARHEFREVRHRHWRFAYRCLKLYAQPNVRWLDHLAAKLQTAGVRTSVVNMGISGSRLLRDDPGEFGRGVGTGGLERFDRDVLAQPGVTDLILWLGTNDIGRPGRHAPIGNSVTADELISGFSQLVRRTHERNIKMYIVTILPFKGSTLDFYSAQKEDVRQKVNEWIRRSSGADGVLDFEAVLKDPDHPDQIAAAFDLGDHTHPNAIGEKRLAESVPLKLFMP